MKSVSLRKRQWTLGRKLGVGFSILVILAMVLAAASMFGVRKLDRQMVAITNGALPGVGLSGQMLAVAYEYRVATLRHLISKEPEQMKQLDAACVELDARLSKLLTDYQRTIIVAEDRVRFEEIEPAFLTYRELARRVRALSNNGQDEEANRLANSENVQAYQIFEYTVKGLSEFNLAMGRQRAVDAETAATATNSIITIVSAVVLVVGVLAGIFITRSINRAMRTIAETINDASSQVASASGQVSASSQSLAEGASEQAASLEETSASLEEMSSMAKRNLENAEQAKELAGQTRTSADAGAEQMSEMRTAMDEIKASSDEIGKIVKSIDEIAFQTNILALNAAVEAARAGEFGAGFAVVAEEVRALAQRSAQSARETADKIEVAIQKSNHGVEISANVAAALAEIVEKARRVDAFVAEIAQASREQNEGIRQVNTAVSQMDKVTQSNASNAEETAAAAEELSSQSQSLRETVEDLMRLIDGGSQAAQSAPVNRKSPGSPRHAEPRQDAQRAPSRAVTRPSQVVQLSINGAQSKDPATEDSLTFFR